MAKRIGILVLHGMGEQPPDFDHDLKAKLLARLGDTVASDVAWQNVYYQPIMQHNQEEVWKRVAAQQPRWMNSRRFFLYGFSDAATYEHSPGATDSVYKQVHEVIREAMDALQTELGDENAPLVIFAHSLGCQVISNYIWDAMAGKGIWAGRSPSDFHRFKTLSYMFTAGCNIPLFVSGMENIEAINKPNDNFQWLNYYDKDDFLGWPLKPLSTGFENSYDAIVTQDIPINAHRSWNPLSWLASWTPAAHTMYWVADGFINPVAKHITSLYGEQGNNKQ